MKTRRLFSAAAQCAAILLFLLLLAAPQKISVPVRDSLRFCAEALVPSLFVYMVLSSAVVSLPVASRLLSRFGCELSVWLLGTLCGLPIGAVAAEKLYLSGAVDKRRAEFLLAFTNNAGISFLSGYVGAGLFGSTSAGLRLAAYQAVSSAVSAFVLKRIMFGGARIGRCPPPRSSAPDLRKAIVDSASAMINICACAVFFAAISDFLSSVFMLRGAASVLLRSVLEFSSGCAAAGEIGGREGFALCAFACGQTGLSVAMQIRAVTGGRLSMRPYFAGKAVNCAVFTALAYFVG